MGGPSANAPRALPQVPAEGCGKHLQRVLVHHVQSAKSDNEGTKLTEGRSLLSTLPGEDSPLHALGPGVVPTLS